MPRKFKPVWNEKGALLSKLLCSFAALCGHSPWAHASSAPKLTGQSTMKARPSTDPSFVSGGCEDLAGTMGRMNDFDLAKLGQALEPVRFGLLNCKQNIARKSIDSAGTKLLSSQEGSQVAPDFGSATKPIIPHPVASKSVFDGNYALVGVSVASIPSFEGSRHNRIMPVPGAMGRLHGVEFRMAGPMLTFNLIPAKPGAKLNLSFGPSLRYRFNRASKTGDDVIDKLGKLDGVIEAGATTSVTVNRVFNHHDMLSLGVSARWDISGKNSGMLVSPSATYLTPVSKAQVIGAMISADIVDHGYAKYNYSVSATGAASSGLPTYDARGGVKAVSFAAFTARDLNGTITDGGLSIGLGTLYTKLCGSAAETPITKLRGKRSQWIFGGALAYAF